MGFPPITFSYNFTGSFSQSTWASSLCRTDKDPDYHSSDNFSSGISVSWKTVCDRLADLLMAVTFNILKLFSPQEKRWLSSGCFQQSFPRFRLFYFGTWPSAPRRKWEKFHIICKVQSKKPSLGFYFSVLLFSAIHFEHSWFASTPCVRLWREKKKPNSMISIDFVENIQRIQNFLVDWFSR